MLSLQTLKTHIPNPQKKALSLKSKQKRASSFSSFLLKGSMTVEGSLVLPLFLFYVMTLLYLLEMVRFQSCVCEAMHRSLSYAWTEMYTKESSDLLAERDFSAELTAEVKNRVLHYLREEEMPFLCVENGEDGISLEIKTDTPEEGDMEVTVSYRLRPLVSWLQIGDGIISDSMMLHGFVGYTGGFGGDDGRERYVYVTPSGTKYHLAQTCSYIKVRLLTATGEEIDGKRNESREIYRPCELCRPKKEGILYYTAWGNRFHNDNRCSGIKKNVFMIPLSEVGGRTACSKCG